MSNLLMESIPWAMEKEKLTIYLVIAQIGPIGLLSFVYLDLSWVDFGVIHPCLMGKHFQD